MNNKKEKTLTYAEINDIDIVDFLSSLGFGPAKIRGNNFWYLSPFRNETNPSFKVNRKRNRWYDFGDRTGTTLVDFCIRFYKTSLHEVLEKFPSDFRARFVPQNKRAIDNDTEQKIIIQKTSLIESPALIHYLRERRVSINVAQKFCCEAHFQIGEKEFYAIGFKNDLSGYELRNKFFKGSISPKSPTLMLAEKSDDVFVFEGLFDFLSFFELFPDKLTAPSNFLILNSLSFFESSIPVLNNYQTTRLFLNNDTSGDKMTTIALSQVHGSIDQRQFFKEYKDLNDFLCGIRISRSIKISAAFPDADKNKPPRLRRG